MHINIAHDMHMEGDESSLTCKALFSVSEDRDDYVGQRPRWVKMAELYGFLIGDLFLTVEQMKRAVGKTAVHECDQWITDKLNEGEWFDEIDWQDWKVDR